MRLVDKALLFIASSLAVAFVLSLGERDAQALVALVRINGKATPVYFNDGDTYRPLSGPHRFRSARLAGFNTLESYGPTHQWGTWTFKELYVNAKQATLNARRGKWSCDLDPSEKDGYGRVLAICKDLALDQIKKGLAHAYNIDGPSPMYYIKAQRQAILKKRGMWAKGVPPMVLTSLHSVDERFNNKNNYNRLISSLDGKSSKWKHQDEYEECQEVCHMGKVAAKERLLKVIKELRADPDTTDIVKGYEDPYLIALLNEYTTMGRVAEIFDTEKGHVPVKKKLDELLEAGVFGDLQTVKGACMYYATFERRYIVKPKPECLKW